MIEEPGAELEKTGAHPTMWGYRFRAGNGKPGKKKAGSLFRAKMRIFTPIKVFLKC